MLVLPTADLSTTLECDVEAVIDRNASALAKPLEFAPRVAISIHVYIPVRPVPQNHGSYV